MTDAPLDLYGFWRSQATFRVRVALNLKAIAFREIAVDLDAGAQNEPGFRAVNSAGGVPALMIGDAALTQSTAILEYLEETHPEPPLLPSDPLGRARVRAIATLAISDAHPLIVPRVKRYLMSHDDYDATRWKAWQRHWFGAGLKAIEERLAGDPATGAFCHGDAPGLADICVAGLLAGARTFKLDIAAIPTIEAIVTRCMALPAFDAARAERQGDFPG